MKLISWNINGVRAVAKKGLHEFIKQQSPDILCLQETKIQHDQLIKEDIFNNDLLPEDYTFFKSAAEKKGYSGVLTLIKDKHLKNTDEKNIKLGLGNTSFDSEGRFVVSDHKDFLLYNMYLPSGTSGEVRQEYKYKCLDYLKKHIKTLSKKDRERLILCGDFNICHKAIDIHHPETAEKKSMSGFLPEERAWFDSLTKLGLHDAFREVNGEVKDKYSWWSYRAGARGKNLGWRIDYFLVGDKIKKKLKDAQILNEVLGSDHCPITLEF